MALDPNDAEQFMVQARIKLLGASDSGIKSEMYEVLKEFFKDTNSWTGHQYLNVTTGVQKYLLTPDDGGRILRLDYVCDGDKSPVAAFMPHFGVLHVRQGINVSTVVPAQGPPYPNLATSPWQVWYTETIKLPTTRDEFPNCPPWVLSIYSECILDGVLGRMMAQEDKSYSSDSKALYHLKRFRSQMVEARVAARRQNTFGAQNWRFPDTWQTRSQRGYYSTPVPRETSF